MQISEMQTVTDPVTSAREAGLRYVTDQRPGIVRELKDGEFVYFGPDKSRITNERTLERIRRLAIPPAYTDVWICPIENGHLQATGRDARGRKQYRYHPCWREVRDESKYHHMVAFGRALPKIRKRVEEDLARPGLPREKVLATIVRLLEKTLIRVGNDEYARTNHSYGLTTMRDRHAQIHGNHVTFKFRGKHGKQHNIDVEDRHLSRIVKRCRDLPGQDLFQYVDSDGKVVDVESADVNAYLREISGEDFTAKDFRTWYGTVLAAVALKEFENFASQREAKRNVQMAIEAVAKMLGNTPAICRKCYIHPEVISCYMDGSLKESVAEEIEEVLKQEFSELTANEIAVMGLLLGKMRVNAPSSETGIMQC